MKADRYTKALLTLIAVCLAILAFDRSPKSATAAPNAGGSWDNVAVVAGGVAYGFTVIDKGSGVATAYELNGNKFKRIASSKIPMPGSAAQAGD
jgi:hypothetical protein